MPPNKYIHPRNPYKIPPNFRELALKYPDFREFVIQDLHGKVRYDFKREGAIAVLTKTLLHRDFQLDVEFPPDRLVPTLTLRLNYLLWLDDLLKGFADMDNVRGIDIGTGASCIYPLLAASKFKWNMLATEIDLKSIQFARKNVSKNNLNNMIAVKQVDANKFLDGVIDDVQYDFCMCNPPFFSDETELDMFSKSRTAERNPPRNNATGSSGELVVDGGEIAFIEKIINDSESLGTKIRLYSVMVGHKRNVGKLREILMKKRPNRILSGKFCQGRTMRWGLAWTFDKSLSNLNAPPNTKKLAADGPPFSFFYPTANSLEETMEKLLEMCDKLQIEVSVEEEEEFEAGLSLTAYENTWHKSRKQRREEMRKAQNSAVTEKKTCNPDIPVEPPQSPNDLKRKLPSDINEGNKEIKIPETSQDSSHLSTSHESSRKKPKILYLHCSLALVVLESSTNFSLQYLEGIGGRQAAHQLLQYMERFYKMSS